VTTTSYQNVDLSKESHAIEIENLKNINVGLTTKLASYNDLKNDVATYNQRLVESDNARNGLQH